MPGLAGPRRRRRRSKRAHGARTPTASVVKADQIAVLVAAGLEPPFQRDQRFANVVVADGGRVHPRERIERGANRGPGQESDRGEVVDDRDRDRRLPAVSCEIAMVSRGTPATSSASWTRSRWGYPPDTRHCHPGTRRKRCRGASDSTRRQSRRDRPSARPSPIARRASCAVGTGSPSKSPTSSSISAASFARSAW